MKFNRLFVTFLIVLPAPIASAQTLDDYVRKQGNVDVVMHNEYQPATLGEVVSRADLIVEASPIAQTALLSTDRRSAFTDYVFYVSDVLKHSRDVSAGSRITVRRNGGRVIVLGHTVNASEGQFAPFVINETFILFLRYDDSSKTFGLPFGPQGALRIQTDVVSRGRRVWTLERTS